MGNPPLLASAVALSLLLSCQPLSSEAADHHYVRVVPDLSRECDETGGYCYTFSESLQEPGEVFRSNTSIQFSTGEYNISYGDVNWTITIAGVTNLALLGPDSSYGQALITCHSRFRFDVLNGKNITVAKIVFSGCGSWTEHSSGALIFNKVSSLTVASVTVRDGYGYGLMATYLSGNITISNCTFFNNSAREGHSGNTSMGGNCLLHFNKPYRTVLQSSLRVSDSWFVNGIAEEVNIPLHPYVWPVPGGGGLAVYFVANVIIMVKNCTFVNNSALLGGNALLHVYDRSNTVGYRKIASVDKCTFQGGRAYVKGGGLHVQVEGSLSTGVISTEVSRSRFIGNKAWKGGGLSIALNHISLQDNVNEILILSRLLVFENQAARGGGIYTESGRMMSIIIEYSHIKQNVAKNGAGVHLYSEIVGRGRVDVEHLNTIDLGFVKQHEILSIRSTNFTANNAELGSALSLQVPTLSHFLRVERCPLPAIASVWLKDVWIVKNIGDSSVNANTLQWIVLENTTFLKNLGRGIYANNSRVVLTGYVTFDENYGYSGGAMWLDCHCDPDFSMSYLYLMNSSYTTIANNQALKYGGGIFISEECRNANVCFFQRMHTDKWRNTTLRKQSPSHSGIERQPCTLFWGSSIWS